MDKLKVVDLTNQNDINNILKIKTNKKISHEHFKYFNDYNVNNYLVCVIHIDEYKIKNLIYTDGDLVMYDNYQNEYLKYYFENPDVKLIVLTNSVEWCKQNFIFFNTFYYSI